MAQRQPYMKHKPPEQDPSLEDFIWFIGFFEGEGAISQNMLIIYQKDPEPLQKVLKMWGGRLAERPIRGLARARWEWWACGDLARYIAKLIYPHLSTRRKIQLKSKFFVATRKEIERKYLFAS